MEKKIQASFSSIKPKRTVKPRPEIDVPDHKDTITAVETDKEAPITMVHVLFKKSPTPAKTKLDYRRELMKSVFSGMLSSRLTMHMVSDSPPYMFAGANFAPYVRNKEVYSMVGITEPKNVKATLSTFLKEIRRVRELGFDEDELRFAKEIELKLVENKYNEREKVESGILANSIVQHFLQKKPMPGAGFDHAFSKGAISSITQKEVNALAKEMLAEANRVIVIVGEEKAGVLYPTGNEIASLMKTVDIMELKEIEDSVANKGDVIEESTIRKSKKAELSNHAAKITNERSDTKSGVTYLELSNGAKIALRPDPNADRVMMRAFSPGGLSLIDQSRTLSRDFIAMFDGDGGITSQHDALSKTAGSGRTTRVTRRISDSHEYLIGNSSSDGIDDLLSRVKHQFREDILDSFMFDGQISILRTLYGKTAVDPQVFFGQEVHRTMTQGSPLASSMLTAEQIGKLSLTEVNDVYRDRFRDVSDFTFILTGSFRIEMIKPLLLQHLGSLPGENRVETWKDLGIRPPGGTVKQVIRKGEAQKSFVRLVFTDEAKYDPVDDRILRFLGNLLEIKLLEVLREEKAGVYTASSSGGMFRHPYERFEFAVEFPCGPESVDLLIEAAVGEIAKLQDGQILQKDLDKVKMTLVRKSQENAKGSEYWADAILSNLRDGTGIVSLDETERRIKSVSRDDIVRIAKKYLKIGEIKQFVLMPDTVPQNGR